MIMVQHDTKHETPEDRANAFLLAAAPDLLDACRAALAHMRIVGCGPELRDQLRDAIAISQAAQP
jgi:hypothetical protein